MSTVTKKPGTKKTVSVSAPGASATVDTKTLLEDGFPQDRVVLNNTRSKLIFPSVDAIVGPGGKARVTFTDEGQLQTFVTDAQQLCALNGSDSAIVIKSLEQDAADEAEAKAKAAAKVAEKKE